MCSSDLEYEAGRHGEPELDDAAVDDVAARMRGVDWAAVRTASAEKGSDAAEAMRSMAQKVDWDKVQPVAAKVSSALIAAVAAGQLPIGGTSGRVARAILNDQRFADRIGARLPWSRAARQLTLFAAREKDAGRRCDLEAGMAKLLGARVAWAAADNALQIHGGNGFALEYAISRVLCDARILNIFEGAAEIQAQVIARRLLEG